MLQVLPEGVKVEVSVLADCIKLVVPVVHEDAAVHIVEVSAATDAAWTHGEGPEVTGPLTSLVLAMSGRSGAIEDLRGEGGTLFDSRI